MGISCCLKLIKFTKAQVKLTWAQALVGPGVYTPLLFTIGTIGAVHLENVAGDKTPSASDLFCSSST